MSPPRLKIYEARLDGLHDYIVAAPNQAEALAAWDVHQDLFAQGAARVTEEAAAAKAALAHPGEVLRRPADGGEFSPVQTRLRKESAGNTPSTSRRSLKKPSSSKARARPRSSGRPSTSE